MKKHSGGVGVEGGGEGAVAGAEDPDFPDVVEAEFGGADADGACGRNGGLLGEGGEEKNILQMEESKMLTQMNKNDFLVSNFHFFWTT